MSPRVCIESRRASRSRRIRSRIGRVLLAAGLAVLVGGAAPDPGQAEGPAAAAAPPARLGAARGPEAELGSEFWTLSASFDTGELLVVELCITNVGLGDGNAAVLGHWVEADGSVLAFDGAKAARGWTLSPDRRRLEIGKLALDLRGAEPRLEVWKERLQLQLELGQTDQELPIDGLTGADHGFELLALSAPASGHVQPRGGVRRTLRGRATLTHRWVEQLESRLVGRRIELFANDGDLRGYLVDALSPSGAARSWLVIQDGGRILHSGPTSVRIEMPQESAATPFPRPGALVLEGPAVLGRVELADPVLAFAPLRDLPAVVQLVVAPFLRWQSSWYTSLFELDFRDRPGGPPSLRGQGLVNVTHFDTVPDGVRDAKRTDAPGDSVPETAGATCGASCASEIGDCGAGCP